MTVLRETKKIADITEIQQHTMIGANIIIIRISAKNLHPLLAPDTSIFHKSAGSPKTDHRQAIINSKALLTLQDFLTDKMDRYVSWNDNNNVVENRTTYSRKINSPQNFQFHQHPHYNEEMQKYIQSVKPIKKMVDKMRVIKTTTLSKGDTSSK